MSWKSARLILHNQNKIFTARCYAWREQCCRKMSVCLSVCLCPPFRLHVCLLVTWLSSSSKSAVVNQISSKSDDFFVEIWRFPFSRWRLSTILNFMGSRTDSLKSPCRTSYWSSIETMALNSLVFEKVAFSSRSSRQRDCGFTHRWCPSVCPFVCLSVAKMQKNAIFSKTKQFRAMVSI